MFVYFFLFFFLTAKIVEYPSWFFTFFWDDSKISYIFKQFVFKIKKHKRNRKINKIKMQFIKIQNGPQKCILFSFLFLQGPTRKQTKKCTTRVYWSRPYMVMDNKIK